MPLAPQALDVTMPVYADFLMAQLHSLDAYLSCLRSSFANGETEGVGHPVIYHDLLD